MGANPSGVCNKPLMTGTRLHPDARMLMFNDNGRYPYIFSQFNFHYIIDLVLLNKPLRHCELVTKLLQRAVYRIDITTAKQTYMYQ